MTECNSVSIYDGRDRLGVLIRRAGRVDAFDAGGVHLGTFPNVKAATAAISNPQAVPCDREGNRHG